MLKLNKFSILNILTLTFSSFWNFLGQWKLTCEYAIILTLLTTIIGNWSYSCGSLDNYWWCRDSITNPYIAFGLILFYFTSFIGLFFAFMHDLYVVSIEKTSSELSVIKLFPKTKIKFALSGILFFLIIIISFAVSLWFINAPANPDWHIEAVKFLFIFTTGIIFLISLKVSSFWGGMLKEKKCPNIFVLLRQTSGKGYIILMIFCLILFLMMMLFVNFSFLIKYFTLKYPWFIVALCGEFVGNFIKLITAAIFLAFCHAQYKILENIQSEKSVPELIPQTQAKPSATPEKATKKKTSTKQAEQNKKKMPIRKKATKNKKIRLDDKKKV